MDDTPSFVLDSDLNVDNFRCFDLDEDEFNRRSTDLQNKSFSLLCYNIRSCRRNFALHNHMPEQTLKICRIVSKMLGM